MTVREVAREFDRYAAETPDAKAVLDDNGDSPPWAEAYPEVTEVSRMPDGRVVIR
jgi:hypothetical protein